MTFPHLYLGSARVPFIPMRAAKAANDRVRTSKLISAPVHSTEIGQ